MPTIAENLKALRERKMWSKTEMAEKLGMKSHTTICKWENGSNHPKGREIKQLCELFNVSADFLLGIENDDIAERINYYKYYPVDVSAGELKDIESISLNDVQQIPITDGVMGRYSNDMDIYFINVNGTSMNKIIAPGARIGIKPINDIKYLKDGDIVLFSKGNEFSIKRFYNDPAHERVIFRPESTDKSHTDIVIQYDDMNDVKFHGKVVINIAQYV